MDHKVITLAGDQFKVSGKNGDLYFDTIEDHVNQNEFLEFVLNSYIGESSTFLDIGANSGFTAFLIDRTSPQSKIICVEPGPTVFRCLEQTIADNHLYDCQALNFCVGSRNGTVSFQEVAHFSAGSFITDKADGAISVPMVTVDDIVRDAGLSRLDLIKIDVEGFEEDVILGASETLKRFKPLVFLEFNSYTLLAHHDRSPVKFLDFLRRTFSGVYKHTKDGVERISSDADWANCLRDNLVLQGCVSDLLCVTEEGGVPALSRRFLSDRIFNLLKDRNKLAEENRVLAKRIESTQAWAAATDQRIREVVADNVILRTKLGEG